MCCVQAIESHFAGLVHLCMYPNTYVQMKMSNMSPSVAPVPMRQSPSANLYQDMDLGDGNAHQAARDTSLRIFAFVRPIGENKIT